MSSEREALMQQYQSAAQRVVESGMTEMVSKLQLIDIQRKIEALGPESKLEEQGAPDVKPAEEAAPSASSPDPEGL